MASTASLPVPAILLDKLCDPLAIFQSRHLRKFIAKGVISCQIARKSYVEKLDPQPQLLVEWGLMKLKAWRSSVSS